MPARPNILLLFTDQQRGDALGAAGNPDILTPNLDRPATAGTHFTACHVQNPVCMPRRDKHRQTMLQRLLCIWQPRCPVWPY